MISGCTDTALVVDVSGVYGASGGGNVTYDPDSDGAKSFVRLLNVAFVNNSGGQDGGEDGGFSYLWCAERNGWRRYCDDMLGMQGVPCHGTCCAVSQWECGIHTPTGQSPRVLKELVRPGACGLVRASTSTGCLRAVYKPLITCA